jgi:integrase
MPRLYAKALTPLEVKNAKPGRHADGEGLYLLVKETGARSWVLRYMIAGRSRDLGLSRSPEALALMGKTGSKDITLAQARDVAAIYRMKVRAGIDPLAEREELAQKAAEAERVERIAQVTFRTVAEDYIADHEASWRNPKHRQQWRNTLATYVYPAIGDKPIATITTDDVLTIIKPLWQKKSETASRVRGRIETILNAAKVRGYRTGENPAQWRGHLSQLLPARTKLSRGHHEALPYLAVPDFMASLRERRAMAALALEFAVLTATRTNEVLCATWEEVDLVKGVWVIPESRMKAAREHRVPLSSRALEILNATRHLGAAFLFPGQTQAQLSGMSMAMLLRRMKIAVTVHGFRSSFRDWAAETTGYPHEACEMALAHSIGNKAEAAYRRGDLFDKRRQLMEDWARFCDGSGKATAEVVSILAKAS